MKPIDKLKNLPIVSIAIPSLVLFLVAYFIFLPAIKQYVALSGRIKNKEADLVSVQSTNTQYLTLKEEIKNKELEINQFKKRLFWEIDISKFLNELTRLASDLRIEFISLKPQAAEAASLPLGKEAKETKRPRHTTSKDFLLMNVPIEVVFRSSYNELISFLKRIEEADKFIKIDTLSIESQSNNIYNHNVRMKLSILIEQGV